MMIGKLHTIISTETIKPSSPTPSYLHTYNLSSLDQLAGHKFVPLILFYPNNDNCRLSSHHKAEVMKQSLSQSLTRYYPFAGRLHTPTTPYVDCNDEGVVFVEARINGELKTFLHMIEPDENLDQLFPEGNMNGCIVGVQLNHFACGGIGVAVSMSHIIGDGCTLGSFVNYWASVARYGTTDDKEVLPLNPHFIDYPRTDSPQPKHQVIDQAQYSNRVTNKFVFPNTKLNDLKNTVSSVPATASTPPITNPTRVEVLASLLYKTAIAAATATSGCFSTSYLIMPINIRKNNVQRLPQSTVGNLATVMLVPTRHTTETSLSVMVAEIKKAKAQLQVVQGVQHAAENFKSVLMRLGNEESEDVAKRSYVCTSFCGFPYNKVDFGCGKPLGSTVVLKSRERLGFLLKDTPKGDGIEALVILEKEDMEIFQKDKEMLSFCQNNQF